MRRSFIELRIGVLAAALGALGALCGCGPQPGASPADGAVKPAGSSAAMGEPRASGPEAAAQAQPAGLPAKSGQPSTSTVAASQPSNPKTSAIKPNTSSATASKPSAAAKSPATPSAAPSQPAAAAAGPWAQFRGPERNGISSETGLLKQWPAGGPPLAWKTPGLGTGNGAPSVAGGRIFGMSYRGNDEVVWALDEATGKPAWSVKTAPANFQIGPQAQDGPGCTPTVVGDRLYALGAGGDLVCLQVSDGKQLWRKNLVTDFGGSVPQWGYAKSPLVDGNKVIVTPGGPDATLVALDRMSGAVIWKGKVPQGDGAGYASAIAALAAGQRQYIQLLAHGVVGVSAADGRFLWRYDAPASNFGINCSAPICQDDQVFAASGYNNGGGLAKLAAAPGGGITATEVYFTRNMRNHHGGMVVVNGFLYGFDESSLTCIEFKTGTVRWSDRSVGKGSVTYADGHIYARSERGPVALVEANPERYIEKGRFDQPDRSGKTTWPYPVIANGRLYLRDHDTLLCYSVK